MNGYHQLEFTSASFPVVSSIIDVLFSIFLSASLMRKKKPTSVSFNNGRLSSCVAWQIALHRLCVTAHHCTQCSSLTNQVAEINQIMIHPNLFFVTVRVVAEHEWCGTDLVSWVHHCGMDLEKYQAYNRYVPLR